jgi:hypothetical protein
LARVAEFSLCVFWNEIEDIIRISISQVKIICIKQQVFIGLNQILPDRPKIHPGGEIILRQVEWNFTSRKPGVFYDAFASWRSTGSGDSGSFAFSVPLTAGKLRLARFLNLYNTSATLTPEDNAPGTYYR